MKVHFSTSSMIIIDKKKIKFPRNQPNQNQPIVSFLSNCQISEFFLFIFISPYTLQIQTISLLLQQEYTRVSLLLFIANLVNRCRVLTKVQIVLHKCGVWTQEIVNRIFP